MPDKILSLTLAPEHCVSGGSVVATVRYTNTHDAHPVRFSVTGCTVDPSKVPTTHTATPQTLTRTLTVVGPVGTHTLRCRIGPSFETTTLRVTP